MLDVSRVTLLTWRRKGLFPRPVRHGGRGIRWLRDDVETWLAERPRA